MLGHIFSDKYKQKLKGYCPIYAPNELNLEFPVARSLIEIGLMATRLSFGNWGQTLIVDTCPYEGSDLLFV